VNTNNMPKLHIGELEVRKPIIQGGMGVGISMSGLASAVADEGGIGVISSVGLGLVGSHPEANYREANKIVLKKEIRKARALTDGVLGLNIMVAVSDFDDLLNIALEEEIDIVFLGAGLPLRLPKSLSLETFNKIKTKTAVIVSSARAVQIIFQYWKKNFNHLPDMVVVEGPLAGGHLGFKKEQLNDPNFALERLVTEVITIIKYFEEQSDKSIPVIAAGGIYSGSDIFKFLELGAQGVQMATRFVATHECDASPEFKEAYIKCEEADLVIIDSPVGLPGRAIGNKFLEEVAAGIRKPFNCPWKCLKTCNFREVPYCIAHSLTNAKKGKLAEGFTFAGANAYRIKEIISVKELFTSLEQEFEDTVRVNSIKNNILEQSKII
jgi:nitronate monooxygenase